MSRVSVALTADPAALLTTQAAAGGERVALALAGGVASLSIRFATPGQRHALVHPPRSVRLEL